MSQTLTHVDADGNARMVEVSDKAPTARRAVAQGFITLSPKAMAEVVERRAKKGDVLAIAQLAGIQGAKQTSTLIPLCHPLFLTGVTVDLTVDVERSRVRVVASAKTHGRTGVEMEALSAVSASLLTVYDMLKAVDREMEISGVHLLEKEGGRSGHWLRPEAAE